MSEPIDWGDVYDDNAGKNKPEPVPAEHIKELMGVPEVERSAPPPPMAPEPPPRADPMVNAVPFDPKEPTEWEERRKPSEESKGAIARMVANAKAAAKERIAVELAEQADREASRKKPRKRKA